jgi:hypothetical protein
MEAVGWAGSAALAEVGSEAAVVAALEAAAAAGTAVPAEWAAAAAEVDW